MNLSVLRNALHDSVKCITVLAAVLAASARAQVVFSPPTNVSNGPGTQYGQTMLVDSQGRIYVAWTGSNSASCCYINFSRSTDGGSTFSAPIQISSGNVSAFSFASMALDSAGNIYVSWSTANVPYGVFLSRSADAGATFSAPVQVNAFGTGSQMVVDASGKVDLVWVQETGTVLINPGDINNPPQYAYDFTVYFSQSSDGGNTFSPPTAVFTCQEPDSSQNIPSIQLAADASSNAYVLGEGRFGEFVLVAHSNAGETTFSTTYVQNTKLSSSGSAKMTLDAAGNINMVWSQENNAYHILFSRSTDGGITFSTPQDLTPASPAAENPKVALDSSGSIHVAWLDGSPGYFAVFYSRSTDGGQTFSTPRALSTDPSLGYGLGPYSIAMATGAHQNVTVAWEDNDSANRYQDQYQSQQWDLYLASSTDGGATFQAPVNVSNSAAISGAPAIGMDANSTNYVTWMKSPPSPFGFNVFFSRSMALSSVTVSSAGVTGGGSSTGTVTMNGPAPAGGAVVALSSSAPSVGVPATVTIPEGTKSTTFAVATSPVAVTTTAVITAAFGGVTQTASMAVEPPVLTSLTLNPSSVTGRNSSTGTVTLSGPAPAGGAVVALTSSNSSVATVAPSVTVSAGFTSATFTMNTRMVRCPKSAAITGSLSTVSQTADLAVMPFVTLPSQACSVRGGHGRPTFERLQ